MLTPLGGEEGILPGDDISRSCGYCCVGSWVLGPGSLDSAVAVVVVVVLLVYDECRPVLLLCDIIAVVLCCRSPQRSSCRSSSR
jgi:hypothetical protein